MYIEKLNGTIEAQLPSGIILMVSGVGYGIEMPLSSLCDLPPIGSSVSLFTYSYIKEDSIRLFGFLSHKDRTCFEVLIGLNGVGPKVALATLSTLSLNSICNAIIQENAHVFTAVPGVGKRVAEKILVELKPKLKLFSELNGDGSISPDRDSEPLFGSTSQSSRAESQKLDDIQSALSNLGYKDRVIRPILQKLEIYLVEDFQSLIRRALLLISEQGGGSMSSKQSIATEVAKEIF